MDFPKCDWWNQLCTEADPKGTSDQKDADALRLNVERTTLFPLNIEHEVHVDSFCKALEKVTLGNSVQRAKSTIDDSAKKGKRIMICVGPQASSIGTGVSALIAFSSFQKRYLLPGVRGTADPDFDTMVWDALADPGHYNSIVNPTKEYRGAVPNRFWAVLDDIIELESRDIVTISRLRHFLGLDDNGKPALLIRISTGKGPRQFTIPTGWDGFTNKYFRENRDYNPSDPNTHFGFTLDLESGSTEKPGAREMVAEPVPAGDTELVQRYE
jgi:hypothetical protein